jgi:hypothetical protein
VAEFVVIILNKYRQIGKNYVIVESDRFLSHLSFIILKFGAVYSGLQILSLKETQNTK